MAVSVRRSALGITALCGLLSVFSSGIWGAGSPRKLWSLEPVVAPALPTVGIDSKNPIDLFVAEKYQEKGLKPVSEADKLTLLRRVYFDLIGLPPTVAEQKAFLRDTSPDAYEKVVDKLLANEQYGVRWSRHWLDVLRYADLDGLDGSVMPAATGIYLWRDWVISALNRDMPYDDFFRAQILGNRSKQHTTMTATGQRVRVEPNPEDQFALGFLARGAVTKQNTDQDISLSAVETVSSAFMGMTVACAKCHDHKFDPIKQKDFYAMKALFDPLVVKKVTMATPAEIFKNGELVADYNRKKAPLDEQVEALVKPYRTKLYAERVSMLTPEVQAIIQKPEKDRTPEEQKTADDYFPVLRIDPSKIKEAMPAEDKAKYESLLKEQSALNAPPELPSYWTVEEDKTLLQEKTYILTTGDPKRPEKDKPVDPGFPFMPAGTDLREGRREAFVDWMTAPNNPLFSRVAVNRIWQWHFGQGLQKTPSDFGLLGGKPSNQKLLDYLSSEFVQHNYSMKWLTRLMVTSDTYKMASKADSSVLEADMKADPTNNYLWHFRLQRLEAEPVWDSVKYDSGDLDLAIGGRSFSVLDMPAKGAFETQKKKKIDAAFDTNTNRRSVYMVRGYLPSKDVMPNFLTAFDADDGRVPCPMRGQTVTAPQALFMMNNEMVAKESDRLAHRMLRQSGGSIPVAVNLAYRTTLGRAPSDSELHRALTYINNNPARMSQFSWMLFNLDEFVYVR
jgi:hypothetical protein